MAVTPTGAIYKAFKFNGVSSRNYGIYITGAAVYNAPERDVEMVSIPGRNGSFALDNGRFENIEVSYPAGVYADNETDFAQAISDFRNFLCSRKGYVRLEDDYNPDEYRLAVYKSGLEVTPAQLRAGEFEIVFECMPQRWLKSGEELYLLLVSGYPITNPTRFDSRPLLRISGYGDIVVGSSNGSTISIAHVPLGTLTLSSIKNTASVTLNNTNKLENGDRIYKTASSEPKVEILFKATASGVFNVSTGTVTNGTATASKPTTKEALITISPTLSEFHYGTSSTITTTAVVQVSGDYSKTITFTLTTSYNGSTTITMAASYTAIPTQWTLKSRTYTHPVYYGDSSRSVLPDPIYIDLDIGEAYGEVEGEMTSLDSMVTLPAELPVFKPGRTIITYPNTVTKVYYTPRWWII